MNFRYLILFYIFGIQISFGGILDSISIIPPQITIEQADLIREEFESDFDEFCYLPGSVLYYYNDSTCYSPVQAKIDNYDSDDSISLFNYKMAMYTYDKFGSSKEVVKNIFEFSHETFLDYLEEEEQVKDKGWLIKIIEWVSRFIDKYLMGPLEKLFSMLMKPLAKLSPFWKIFFILLSSAMVIFITFIIGKFFAKIYPDTSAVLKRRVPAGSIRKITASEWLQKAKEFVKDSDTTGAVECLYRYLIGWTKLNNRVRRYEWWTNRQLLNVIKKRFPDDYQNFSEIIYKYELGIYGHVELSVSEIEDMILLASTLKGVRV